MVHTLLAALPLIVATTIAAPAGTPDLRRAEAPDRIECHCRANGRNYELGARVCLLGAHGYRLAECRMQQNVTSWTFGPEDCSPTATRIPAEPGTGPAAFAFARS